MDFQTTDERIRHLVAHSAGVSRSEIAAALRLPAPTVTSAVRRLLADGAVVESEHVGPRSVAGRRPHLLYVAGRQPCLGVIACSHQGVRLTVADYGATVLHTSRLPRPDTTDDPAFLVAAIERLQRAAQATRPRRELSAVVVSLPAPFQQGVGSPGQRLPVRRDGPRTARQGTPTFFASFSADPSGPLGERFGMDVYVENDANLAALGEFSAGAGRGQSDQVYLLLDGSSVGTGIVVGGRLVRGATGYAGELAHVQVDEDGPLCACGGRGCLSHRLGVGLLASVQGAYAQPVTFADLLRMAAAGDAGPTRILQDLGRTIGRPLADVCTVLNPGLIVVDGRLDESASAIIDGIREQVERFTPPAIGASVRIVQGALTDSVAVHGAIELARSGR